MGQYSRRKEGQFLLNLTRSMEGSRTRPLVVSPNDVSLCSTYAQNLGSLFARHC